MGQSDKSKRDELLSLNKEQAQFYDTPNSQRKFNPIMNLWRILRRRMYFLMQNSGVWSDVYSLQKEWMGDLSGKKVLDFGCFDGNVLSGYIAENAASYLGVDLSKPALGRLSQYFEQKGINGTRVHCVDVLSGDFTESGFDIIYAEGVLHHFNPIDVLLPILYEKLAPGGKIISLDPLQTSFLTRGVRAFYHPFRSDKEWEWPFTKDTFKAIRQYFTIGKFQGVFGFSKWAIPVAFIHERTAVALAKYLHSKDLSLAGSDERFLWGCMQVAMRLEKKEI